MLANRYYLTLLQTLKTMLHKFKILVLLVMFVLGGQFAMLAQNATDIIKKAEDKVRGNSSIAEMSFKIVRPTWNRTMDIKSWAKGNEMAVILIQAPAKDKGTAFLKRKKDVWNWLPNLDRTIKLPPSMMAQSWMGTDFTNDDLVRESSAVEDYTHELLGEEMLNGLLCYKIQLTPKPDAAVVWGKVLTWIDKKDYLQLKTEFFDEYDELVNTLIGSDAKEMGGRFILTKMVMTPADKNGHRTEITYKSLQFNPSLKDDFFTLQNIKKLR